MADDGGAYPWRSRFNLADLDSTLPLEVLSLGLALLTIFPLIDPSTSSWTAGGIVIGHGNGGKYIPIMARIAKARCWSKR